MSDAFFMPFNAIVIDFLFVFIANWITNWNGPVNCVDLKCMLLIFYFFRKYFHRYFDGGLFFFSLEKKTKTYVLNTVYMEIQKNFHLQPSSEEYT